MTSLDCRSDVRTPLSLSHKITFAGAITAIGFSINRSDDLLIIAHFFAFHFLSLTAPPQFNFPEKDYLPFSTENVTTTVCAQDTQRHYYYSAESNRVNHPSLKPDSSLHYFSIDDETQRDVTHLHFKCRSCSHPVWAWAPSDPGGCAGSRGDGSLVKREHRDQTWWVEVRGWRRLCCESVKQHNTSRCRGENIYSINSICISNTFIYHPIKVLKSIKTNLRQTHTSSGGALNWRRGAVFGSG